MKNFLLQTFAFAYRNAIFAKRNVFVLVEMLFWPTMGLLTIGLMGDFLHLEEGTLAFVLTGAIASGVLQVAQLDVGYSLLYDVWSKSIKHTFLTPSGLLPALAGPWLIGILRGGIVFAALAWFAHLLFAFNLPGFWPVLFFLAGLFWMSLLAGIFVWILILSYGQRAEIAVWAITYVVMLLCGIYYPVQYLPQPFYALARLVPLTYFMDEVRSHYGFGVLFRHGLLTGWLLNFAYALIGIGAAQLSIHRARRTGILLQLSE